MKKIKKKKKLNMINLNLMECLENVLDVSLAKKYGWKSKIKNFEAILLFINYL